MKLWMIFLRHVRHFLEGLENTNLNLKLYLQISFRPWALENLNHASIVLAEAEFGLFFEGADLEKRFIDSPGLINKSKNSGLNHSHMQ